MTITGGQLMGIILIWVFNTNKVSVFMFIGEATDDKELFQVQDLFSKQSYPLAPAGSDLSVSLGSIMQLQLRADGMADIDCVLASPGSARASLYQIAAQFDLDPLFSPAIEREVEAILKHPQIDDVTLEDLTHLAFCTIDGAGTRDLDQALYIEKTQEGHRVYYALADASFYVQPGTALFDEALKRGASYYLLGLMIPMLPRPLCEGLVSLNEGVERRAMVFQLELDVTGQCVQSEVIRARINSRGKLSFQQVQDFLDQPQQYPVDDPLLADSLRQLKAVGEHRLQLLEERHIVRYRRNESHVKLGDQGMKFSILGDLRNDVEQYNEQLSLLCNTEGARLLADEGVDLAHVQPIYRVHPQPSHERIAAFERGVDALVQAHQLDPSIWAWQRDGDKPLAEYLRNLPSEGEGNRIAQAIHRQAVLTNVRSIFSEQAGRHYGVGSDVYARFSAPMREIVGVFLHKELFEKLSEPLPAHSNAVDEQLRSQIIAAANRSKDIQRKITREANRLVLDHLFQEDIDKPYADRCKRAGTVMGLDRSKLYVLLDQPAVEVKVYTSHLTKVLATELQLNEDQVLMKRTDNQQVLVRVGDSVLVVVQEKDEQRDRWLLMLDGCEA